jgi:adenylate cyclase
VKIKIRDAFILINTLLIVTTAAIIITINSTGTQSSVYSISNNLVMEIVNSVLNKVQVYFQPAEKAVRDIGFHYWTKNSGDFGANKEVAVDYLLETLRSNDEFVMVYFADAKGNLIMGRRMPDGSLSKRYITRTKDAVITTYVHSNKEYIPMYPNVTESLETGYDPRTRGWYKMAVEKKTLVWTDVYIFATDRMPGFSCALPVFYEDGTLEGVVCVDIGIQNLSLFLGKISITPNSKLFIVDSDKNIIAKPLKQDGSLNELFDLHSVDGKTEYALKKVNDPKDPVMAAAYANYEAKKSSDSVTTLTIGNYKYFSNIASIELEKGKSLRIGVVVPDEDIMGIVYRNNRIVLIISFGVILFAVMISILVSAVISNPMKLLSREMNEMKRFIITEDGGIRTSIVEIAGMVDSFEGMKKGLTNFKLYVPADVVRILMQNDKDATIGGEKKTVTVFFSDIENFTGISETLDPEELLRRLYEYFSIMSGAIHKNKGTLDKYIGDSIMAFWGAPLDLEDHAYYACRSALECRNLGSNLSSGWAREGKDKFRTRMGLHSGEVIVGNMGSDDRINYTVLGDSVNLASRLEGINKYYGTEIAVSETTHEMVKDRFEFRMLDRIAVKGKSQPVAIYELLAEKEKLDKKLLKIYGYYEDGLSCYFEGKWDQAIKYMDFVLRYVRDTPATVIKSRAETYKAAPPKDWNGVYSFSTK